jgi:glycosyltransferase involved in cell wall biosynthesis
MNVYLIHYIDFPEGTACTAHSKLMIQGLRKNGVKASLLIPHGGMLSKNANNKRLIGHFEGVPYCYLNNRTTLPSKYRFFTIIRGNIKTAIFLYKKRKKTDYIILATPDFIRFLPIILICFIAKIHFIVWAVERMSLSKDIKGIKGRIQYFGNLLSEIILPKISSGYIVISNLLMEYYLKKKKDLKIILSPILINPTEEFKPANHNLKKYLSIIPNNNKILLYTGTFGENDGFNFILEAYAKVRELRKDVILVTTGKALNNKTNEFINKKANELQIEEYVVHLGFLKRYEMREIIHKADVLLVCRVNSLFANYGFPWKLGEYCMTKRPIISTKISDLPVYFKDNESIFFVDPENPYSLSKKILEVLDNYKNSLKVAKNGFKIASNEFNYLTKMYELKMFIKDLN